MKIHAQKLKKLRTRRGWTQQQLAELTDLSLRTIQRIEKTGLISHESLGAICSVFEILNAELLCVEEESNSSDLRSAEPPTVKNKIMRYTTHVIAMVIGGIIGGLITMGQFG